MADEFHQRFCEVVVNARPSVESTVRNDVRWPGIYGLPSQRPGLIDEIGYLDDAIARSRNWRAFLATRRSCSITARATPPFTVFSHAQRSLAGQATASQRAGTESFAPAEFPLPVGDGSHGRNRHGKIEMNASPCCVAALCAGIARLQVCLVGRPPMAPTKSCECCLPRGFPSLMARSSNCRNRRSPMG